jgi:hypothetical protein
LLRQHDAKVVSANALRLPRPERPDFNRKRVQNGCAQWPRLGRSEAHPRILAIVFEQELSVEREYFCKNPPELGEVWDMGSANAIGHRRTRCFWRDQDFVGCSRSSISFCVLPITIIVFVRHATIRRTESGQGISAFQEYSEARQEMKEKSKGRIRRDKNG